MKRTTIDIIISIIVTIIVVLIYTVLFAAEATVSWDKNLESDLSGYKIYYGTSSANYGNIIDVGNNISYTVTNLDSNITYYFAITAYDLSGNESEFSKEVLWLLDNTSVETPTKERIESTAYNYKNPFDVDSGTDIVFITEKSGTFSIDIYTVEGKLVKNLISNQEITEGTYKFKWDSTDNNGLKVNLGVYFGKLKLNSKTITIKMVIKS